MPKLKATSRAALADAGPVDGTSLLGVWDLPDDILGVLIGRGHRTAEAVLAAADRFGTDRYLERAARGLPPGPLSATAAAQLLADRPPVSDAERRRAAAEYVFDRSGFRAYWPDCEKVHDQLAAAVAETARRTGGAA